MNSFQKLYNRILIQFKKLGVLCNRNEMNKRNIYILTNTTSKVNELSYI